MTEKIKHRLLHFSTGGEIIPDFISARLKKSARLRRVIRFCFYAQSLFAAACVIVGIAMGEGALERVFAAVAGLAVIAVAFFAVGGGTAEKTVSYIMNLAYAAVCFILGGVGMYICGGFMLGAALAALVSFFADYMRRWLMAYSPLDIRSCHYTLIQPQVLPDSFVNEEVQVPPRSELMEIAEAFAEILK